MGGSSTSSNSTKTSYTTKTSSVGVSGDNNGTVLAGISDSNITMTDGGSVQAALQAMTSANANVTTMAQSMVSANTDLSKYAIDKNSNVGIQALVAAQTATTDAMDVMKNLSLNSDSGTAQELGKYFMYGAIALSVAFAMRGKF